MPTCKEDTAQRIAYRKYEELHKEERKAKCGNFQTMIERALLEDINNFLKKYNYTKVQLIKAGYQALLDEVAEHDTELAKIMDGYDDFFGFELENINNIKSVDDSTEILKKEVDICDK